MNISIFEDDSIIICPNELKDDLIKEINETSDIRIKFFSKSEIMKRIYFSYDDNAIAYLISKGKSYSTAKEILDNLTCIKKGNDKLDELYDLYLELDKDHLLKRDYFIKSLFNNRKVYIIGYSKLDNELINALNNIHAKFEFVERENKNLRPEIIEVDTMEEEINIAFLDMAKLIKNGTSFNDIYLFEYPEEYDLLIKKYAIYYSFPIEFENEQRLSDTKVFKEYILLLQEKNDLEEAYNSLSPYSYNDYGAKDKLVSLINDVMNIKYEGFDIVSYLKDSAKGIRLKSISYDNSIKMINADSIKNGHVFILGFSQGDYPKISKDTDFFSDKEKEILSLNLSHTKNMMNEEKLTYFIENQENLHIYRKRKEGKVEKYNTQIAKKLQLKTIEYVDDNIRYSKELSELEVAKYNDVYKNYGIDNELVNGLDSFSYRTFDHHLDYSPLYKNTNKMQLSYSKINEYNKCPFMYFIKRMCTSTPFEDTFYTNLGSLFHKILEDSINKEINLDDYKGEIETKFVTKKDRFFLNLLLPQVLEVIKKNKSFLSYSNFNKEYPEKNLDCRLDENTYLTGKIDKVVADEENKELFIVDYKTNNFSFKKEKVKFGLDLQLPIYSILLRENYPSYKQVGIYIQNVCEKEEKDDKYKLNGITLNDENVIKHLDHTLVNKSDYIKGLMMKKDGSIKDNNSLLKEEDYIQLIKDSEEAINRTIKNIRNGNFDISPLIFDNVSPCDNCVLDAVCFHKPNDARREKAKEKEKE